MACVTCDNTAEYCGSGVFHCSRCGTMVTTSSTGETVVHVPKLVQRCRKFAESFMGTPADARELRRLWHALGINESIHLPEGRKE